MIIVSGGRRAHSRGNSIVAFTPPARGSRSTRPSPIDALRAQLLAGVARIALPSASILVALGVGLPTGAHAQTSSFNGTQATTFTLTTGVDSSPFTFGPNANIGPTAPGTDRRRRRRHRHQLEGHQPGL